jgi:hypothetical protein
VCIYGAATAQLYTREQCGTRAQQTPFAKRTVAVDYAVRSQHRVLSNKCSVTYTTEYVNGYVIGNVGKCTDNYVGTYHHAVA